jgi:hypothetical protein
VNTKEWGQARFPDPETFEVESHKKCFALPEPEAVPTSPTLNSWSTIITLKALANFSPGFALKPWGKGHIDLVATLKELRPDATRQTARQTLSGLCLQRFGCVFPRVSKQTLG